MRPKSLRNFAFGVVPILFLVGAYIVVIYNNGMVDTVLKKMPRFTSEDGERKFWARHDSTDYIDWSKAKRAVFANLKPSTRTISLRLAQSMLDELRVLANKRDVPYQSLLKMFLAERIEREFQPRTGKTAGG